MVYEHLHFQGETLSPMKTIKNIMTSPFLIGTLLGLACNALRVVFPTFLETTLSNVLYRITAVPDCSRQFLQTDKQPH